MMRRYKRISGSGTRSLIVTCLALVASPSLHAIDSPDGSSPLAAKAYRHPDLRIPPVHEKPADLAAAASTRALADLATLGNARPDAGRLDVRGGRWSMLLPGERLLSGVASRGASGASPTPAEAWQALMGYLHRHRAELAIDPAELVQPGRVAIHAGGQLIQVHAPRVFGGVPVRDSYLTAVINHGNLVLLGAVNWGDVGTPTAAALSRAEAVAKVEAHVMPTRVNGTRRATELVLVPLARGRDAADVTAGNGYDYRLAWLVRPAFADALENWEALVDAHTGELLSFEDANVYATPREVTGGVYPVSNDGISPDGVEAAGWPMPFSEIVNGPDTLLTDSGGNAYCLDGDATATLAGPYVKMADTCGAISLTSSGSIDFGTSGGTDCATPGIGGAGNTHASRSGFHELNRIFEQGRGQLPGNTWLTEQLTANMNIVNTCNATWNGAVNFYRSGGGCANTGEIAGVFDHEWGHGLDDNDVNPFISNPGEGIADLYAYFRLGSSCIGRGFVPGSNCGGFGDPCLSCTGVRDIDWAKRASGLPHDVVWADANCGVGGPAPCGGSVHCEGQVYAEAVYDLVERDLPALYGMDHNTAFEVGTRLTYLGAGNVGTWFSCDTSAPQYGGCSATGGYLNYLAADDDNGDLSDGTPHMSAIFAAFDRHGIACDAPAVADSGCAGAPVSAPVVTAAPRDRGVSLSWGAVAGASKYQVFRTDGVFGCDFGKIKIGETTDTVFVDEGLQNGRAYSYIVIPVGAADTCMGPASACNTVTPAPGVNLLVDASSAALAIDGGDGDVFLDNCESATVTFEVQNIGNIPHTGLRIDDVRPVSHPEMSIDAIGGFASSGLETCASGAGSFTFSAAGLSFGDTVTFEVDVTSDELEPEVKSQTLTVAINAEADLQPVASQTWDFESDLDGWSVIQGTFTQEATGGGAGGSSGYLASSKFLDDQCDQVRSPALQLTATSTLSAFTNYDIENFSGQWWDRANVAVLEGATRNAVSPDGGRLYNASGAGATCVTAGQEGWAAVANSWDSSSWSAAALDSADRAGKLVHLDIAYGTDFAVNGDGFTVDRVTLTDFELIVPDAQPVACNARPGVVITAPGNNAEFDVTDPIGFAASATDAEDSDLTAGLDWVSNIDGDIGDGGSLSASLSAGYHTVTASVTDSGGMTGSDDVRVAVTDPPGCVADLVTPGNETVSGPGSLGGVKSVTVSASTVLDGSGGLLTIAAGRAVIIESGVEFRGTASVGITPTPCP